MAEVPITWAGFEGKDAARQWQVQPDGRVRVEVRWGDKDPRYTEHRALESAQGVRINDGDVIRLKWSTEIPADFIATYYPKQDELGSWPDVFLDACSIVEIHDAPSEGPPLNGDWNKLPAGGAPIYTRITRQGHGIIWPDPSELEAQGYLSASTPLTLGVKNQHVLTFKSSADPAAGWLEYIVNGVAVVTRQPAKTMFQGTYNYVMGGIYSRLSIGDRGLLWPVDARSGVIYPGEFVPRMGRRVYQRDDGYPRVILLGDATSEMNPAGQGATVATPTSTGATTPAAPEWLWKGIRGDLDAQVAAAQAEVDAATQRRDALAKVRDRLVAQLGKGAGWLAP